MGLVKIKIRIELFFLGILMLVDLVGSEWLDDFVNISINNEIKKINLSLLELMKVLCFFCKKV